MNLPLVSICIPVYNGEPYIFKTLSSVVNQTYKNLEIIIFDNCSTDKTAELIKSFNDSRIAYHLNDKNYGSTINSLKCLESSKGEFIVLLMADDLLKPNAIEMQVNALINNPDVSLCISATYVIDEFDNVIMKRQLYKKSLKLDGKKIAKKSLLRGRNIYGEPSCVLFRSEKSRQAGYYSDEFYYSTDLDYWLRLSYVGDVYYIHEFLSCFRVASSTQTSEKFFNNFKLLIVDWNNLLKKHSDINVIKLSKLDKLVSKTSVIVMLSLKLVFLVYVKIRMSKLKGKA